jgi:hypothetical protein
MSTTHGVPQRYDEIVPPAQRTGLRKRPSRHPSVTVDLTWVFDAGLDLDERAVLVVACGLAGDQVTPVPFDLLVSRTTEDGHRLTSILNRLSNAGYLALDQDGTARLHLAKLSGRPSVHPAAQLSRSVVYYLRRPTGPIKIGFSAFLSRRLKKLTSEHGELLVLATEPGGWNEEQARHKRFDHLRINPNREWFRSGADLLAHIETLAAGR